MTYSELVFIPSPGSGHLPPSVELAKLLLHRHQRLSITIIIMKQPLGAKHSETPTSTHRLRFIDVAGEETSEDDVTPKNFVSAFIEHQKPHVRNIVAGIHESDSVRLVGFVVDMFCVAMADVADELGVPTYLYFTSSASALGVMFYLQTKHDDEEHDITQLKDSEVELFIPSYVNPVPVKLLPTVMFDKDGGSKTFIDLARRFREMKGIIVNTFEELESHSLDFLSNGAAGIPPLFPVGPVLNMNITTNDEKSDEILTWLNDQPESSVVFLCFGSMGSFNEEQVKEIAVAVERSGHRFLWSLRRPPPQENMGYPKEYENPDEVLPESFLERTSNMGKVIGWAPQMAVLSHPSVGGFVSHCGWNSTLESIWCGVPVAAWPLYAEQHLNAFQLVVDLGMAVEVTTDYRSNTRAGGGGEMFVRAEEIESGIRRLMGDGEMRKKVKEMKEKSRSAVSDGGSSYNSIGRFLDHVMTYD